MHPIHLISLLLAFLTGKRIAFEEAMVPAISHPFKNCYFFREITYGHWQNLGRNLCSTGTHKTHSF